MARKKIWTNIPVKYDGDIMSVSPSVADELGIEKWSEISDDMFMEIMDLERELWLIMAWKRGCGE